MSIEYRLFYFSFTIPVLISAIYLKINSMLDNSINYYIHIL